MAELEEHPAPDPLAGLHKMSTTAGVGTQDYVAISNLAILAAILGLLSSLTFWSEWLLLASGLGMVCAVAALYYIRHSNGTQTGKGLAWLGLVLSVGLGGGSVGLQVWQHISHEPDRKAAEKVIAQLQQAVLEAQSTNSREPLIKAYDELFSLDFKQVWPPTKDEKGNFIPVKYLERWSQWGPIEAIKSSGLFEFFDQNEVPLVATTVLVKFQNSKGGQGGDGYDRFTVYLVKDETGHWKILQFDGILAPPRKEPPKPPQ